MGTITGATASPQDLLVAGEKMRFIPSRPPPGATRPSPPSRLKTGLLGGIVDRIVSSDRAWWWSQLRAVSPSW